ncbi:oligosaccharide flippase family protein [Rhodobacter maris]|uniref:O-antigen/teichoic acid export membrane protein n=1 Tax=Rhodobacter maris TaxID=446682 RepID=A0A285TIX2_9RHOB|nr:oligosaccharide flippase family protein [Rhodobacter maris]SOC20421.1 O-antigen/teichoic acid export membrane protein [Rhodobacter maris]
MHESFQKTISTGAYWSILFGIINKAGTFFGQIAIAWFLAPKDFGLAAIALVFLQVSSLYSAGGMKTLLVQRADHFSAQAPNVFWASTAMNLSIGAAIIVLAEPISKFFGETDLPPLLWAVGVAVAVNGFQTIYFAKIQSELRFKTVSAIKLGEGLLQTALVLILAYLGFGAISIVIPRFITSAISFALAFWMAGKIRITRPALKSSAKIARSAFPLFLFSVLSAMTLQAPIIALSRLTDATTVGLFYWGLQISSQSIFLLATNLREVYIPGLAYANRSGGEVDAIIRKAQIAMSFWVTAICAIQFFSATFLIDLFFDKKWLPAAEVIRWTSVGLLFTPLNVLSVSHLISSKQNALSVKITILQIVFVTVGVASGALIGGLTAISAGFAAGNLAGHFSAGLISAKIRHTRTLYFVRDAMAIPLISLAVMSIARFV